VKTNNGRALAILRLSDEPASLTVKAAGLPDAVIELGEGR